jgi:hypothetical protein
MPGAAMGPDLVLVLAPISGQLLLKLHQNQYSRLFIVGQDAEFILFLLLFQDTSATLCIFRVLGMVI